MIFEPSAKLQRMLAWSDKLGLYYSGSWCELFKTKQFLRVDEVRDRLVLRIREQIIKEANMGCRFHVKTHRLHKHSAYRVSIRSGYKYVIECIPAEVSNETN